MVVAIYEVERNDVLQPRDNIYVTASSIVCCMTNIQISYLLYALTP